MGGTTKLEQEIRKGLSAASAKVHELIAHRAEIAQFLAKMKDTSVPSLTLNFREDIGLQDFLDDELKSADPWQRFLSSPKKGPESNLRLTDSAPTYPRRANSPVSDG